MKMCDSAERLLKILEFGKWEVDPKTGIISINNQDFDALCNKEPFEKCYSVDSDPIDRGKFSTVYHCVSLKTGEEYAAKICSKRRMGVDYMADLVHEIAVCLLLRDCENAVKIVDVFNADSELILILEFAPGGDLQTILDEDLVPYEASVIRILRQVLDALRFTHARNIVHLDIKPQNLVLMGAFPDCCLKLCDFEISRKLTHGFEVREILGTADYVAPEIIHYEPITTKTDMWSFGILTYVLLTGFLPFGGETDQETFIEITKCELDFPEELFEDTSNEAIDFIKKLIVRKPLLRMSAEECLNHPWMNNNQNAATTCIQKSNINSQKHISPPQQQSNIIPQVPVILYPQSNEKLMNSHSQSNINLQKPSYPQSNTNLQKSSSSHLQSITPQQPNSSYSQSKITPQSLSSYCNVLAQQKHASPHTQSSSISYPHSTTQSVPRLSLPLQSNYVEYKHSDLTSPLNYFKPFIDSTNYKLFSQTPTDIYYKQEFQTPLRSHLSSPQTPNSSRKLDENEFNISLQKAFEILESDTTNSDTKVNNSNILSPGYLSPQGYDVNLQPRRYLSVHSSTNSLNKGFSRQNLDHLKNFSKSREILAERLMNSSQKKLISKSRDRLFDGRYRYAKSDSGLIDNIFSSQSDEVLFEANLHPTPYKPLDHSYSFGNVLPIISYLSNCTDDIKSKYKYPDRTKNGFNTLRNKGERPVGTTGRLSERAIYNTANDNYFKENKSSKILKPENNLKTTDRGNRESRDFSNSNVNTTQKIQTPRIRKESEKSSNNDRKSQNINNKSITNLKDAHYNKNSTQNRILPRKNSISHTEMRILERKRRKKEKENRDDSKEESKSIKTNLRMNSLSPIRNFKKSQNGTVNSKKNSPNNSDNNLNKGNQSERITEESFFLHPIKENCKRNNQLQTVKTQTCTAEVLKSKNKADKSTDDKNNFVNRYRDKAKPESKFLTQTKSVINHQTTENKKGLDTITHVNNKARKTRNRDLRSTECVDVKNQNLSRKESFKSADQKTTDINSVTKNYSQKFPKVPDNSQKKVSENENTATKIDIQELEFKSEINFSNERKQHENVKKLENEEIENFDNNDDALTNIIEDNVNKYNTAVLRRKNSSEQSCRVDSGIFSRSTSIDSSTSAESVCTVRAIQIKKSVPTFDFSFLNIFNNDDFNILNFNASYINEVQFHSLPGSVEKGKMAKTFELFKLEYSTSDSKLYDKNACNIPLLNDKKIELYKNGNSNALQNEIPETKFNKHGKQKHIYSKIHKGRLCNELESRDKNSNELHNIEYQKVSELNGKSNENQTENLKELCDNEISDHKKQNANDLTDQKQNVNKNCISLDNPVIFNKFNQEDKSNLIDNLNQNKLKDINYHKDKEDSLKDFLRFKAQTPAPNFSLTRQVKNQTASKSEDSLIQKPSTFYAISKSRSMNIDSPLLGEPRPWGGICEGSVNRAREGFGKKSVKIDMILRKLSEPSHDSKNFETSDVNCKN